MPPNGTKVKRSANSMPASLLPLRCTWDGQQIHTIRSSYHNSRARFLPRRTQLERQYDSFQEDIATRENRIGNCQRLSSIPGMFYSHSKTRTRSVFDSRALAREKGPPSSSAGAGCVFVFAVRSNEERCVYPLNAEQEPGSERRAVQAEFGRGRSEEVSGVGRAAWWALCRF